MEGLLEFPLCGTLEYITSTTHFARVSINRRFIFDDYCPTSLRHSENIAIRPLQVVNKYNQSGPDLDIDLLTGLLTLTARSLLLAVYRWVMGLVFGGCLSFRTEFR